MTRGRCERLPLQRTTLSFASIHRPPGAQRLFDPRSLSSANASRKPDLRWLAPLPLDDVVREANATGRTLVVDETRRTGGVGEGIVAELVERGYRGRLGRVASKDSFIPLGDAARLVLVSEDEIEAAAVRLASG